MQGYDLRAWWENGVTVTNSLQTNHHYHLEVILNMIGYFVAYNIPDFCLAFAFFLAYLHIFGKEMKNYTGDQKSKIRFFDHLSFQ